MNKYKDQSKAGKAQKEWRNKIHNRGFLSCSRKKTFDCEAKAQSFLDNTGHTGEPYKCKHCLQWHNTTKGRA